MGPLLLLTVCTGNVCRSPVAEHALTRHLTARGVPVSARSSGTQGGIPNDQTMVDVAAKAGYDISRHVSEPIDLLDIEDAHLVLGMDRDHLVHIVATAPEAWPKTFTLAELVRRAEALPPGTRAATLDDWLALVGEGRRASDVATAPRTDDIEDPHRRSNKEYREAVARIDELSNRLSGLLVAQVAELQPQAPS